MERAPFGYLVLAIFFGLVAILIWVAAFRYFRERPADLSPKDKAIGFFFFGGPFFGLLHSSLSARGYKLTRREVIGLVSIFAIVAFIIIGSIIHGYFGT